MSLASNSTTTVPFQPSAITVGPPIGFEVTPAGIEAIDPDGARTWICSQLTVISTFRDILGSGWGRLVDVTDRDGTVHHLPLTDADITAKWSMVLRRLIDAGLRLRSDSLSYPPKIGQ